MIGAQAQDARGRVKKSIKTEGDFHAAIDKLLRGYVGDTDMDGIIQKLSALYPVGQYENYYWAMVDLTNDRIHTSSNRRIATAMAANQAEPVYWYVFDQPLAGEYARYGADHPLISTFVFHTHSQRTAPPMVPGKDQVHADSGRPETGRRLPRLLDFIRRQRPPQRRGLPSLAARIAGTTRSPDHLHAHRVPHQSPGRETCLLG